MNPYNPISPLAISSSRPAKAQRADPGLTGGAKGEDGKTKGGAKVKGEAKDGAKGGAKSRSAQHQVRASKNRPRTFANLSRKREWQGPLA